MKASKLDPAAHTKHASGRFLLRTASIERRKMSYRKLEINFCFLIHPLHVPASASLPVFITANRRTCRQLPSPPRTMAHVKSKGLDAALVREGTSHTCGGPSLVATQNV